MRHAQWLVVPAALFLAGCVTGATGVTVSAGGSEGAGPTASVAGTAAAGAAGAAEAPAPSGATSAARSRSHRLTTQEIDGAMVATAFEVVEAVRPAWLRQRGRASILRSSGADVVVYLDGVRVGGVEFLRELTPNKVGAMQYLNGTDATTRFGTDHGGGAILVATRGR